MQEKYTVFMGENELSIASNSVDMTTLTNKSSKLLTWEVTFYGDYDFISIDGKIVKADKKKINGELVSYTEVLVQNKQKLEVIAIDKNKLLC